MLHPSYEVVWISASRFDVSWLGLEPERLTGLPGNGRFRLMSRANLDAQGGLYFLSDECRPKRRRSLTDDGRDTTGAGVFKSFQTAS